MMVKKLLVAVILLCVVLTIACARSTEVRGLKGPPPDSMASIKEEVFRTGREVEKRILEKTDTEPLMVEAFPGELKAMSTVLEDLESVSYPRPQVMSNDFKVQETDPLTGKGWDKLTATIRTNKGDIKMRFFHDSAPRHVENFVYLTRSGYFDGLAFHRYEPGFVIQGGDPAGNGTGGPGYRITAEISETHVEGAVASARLDDSRNPARMSNGSQYYICLRDLPSLDKDGYSVWGIVTEGFDVVMELRKGDIMEKIEIS